MLFNFPVPQSRPGNVISYLFKCLGSPVSTKFPETRVPSQSDSMGKPKFIKVSFSSADMKVTHALVFTVYP